MTKSRFLFAAIPPLRADSQTYPAMQSFTDFMPVCEDLEELILVLSVARRGQVDRRGGLNTYFVVATVG